MSDLLNDEQHQAYLEDDKNVRVARAKIGCLLILILFPAGSTLDFMVYPHLFWLIFKSRMLCELITLIAFCFLFTNFGKQHIKILTYTIITTTPTFIICWMIYISEGAISPYYAGLNLMIIGTCILFPNTLTEAVSYSLFVLIAYLGACIAHPELIIKLSILFNNVYFMVLTSIICCTASRYFHLRRIENFKLRHELNISHQQTAASYEKLSELDKLKSQFFANISHELRTPLTLIISPVETLLTQTISQPKIREILTTVQQNALRLLKLINDLLEIVRLESKQFKIERKPINLAVFVPGMVDSVRHLASTKKITLHTDGTREALMIQGDHFRLEKVLLNLLTNAIKFTPPKGAIHVQWSLDDDVACVRVQDTGMGIAEPELPYIFDRFRQVDAASTKKFQGVGLGLALARELIEEHQGKLTVRSQINQGTTFMIELPVSHEKITATAAVPTNENTYQEPIAHILRQADFSGLLIEKNQPSVERQPVGQGQFLILVVDDEPDMREFLVSILAEEHRVIQASDGRSGLEQARQQLPDLMLLDLMLPDINGLEVCRALRAEEATKAIKILQLTARSDEASKIKSLEQGVDDFLTKPFSTIEVKTRLNNLLRTGELQKNLHQRNQTLQQTLKQLKATEVHLIQSEKMNALGSLAAGLLHEINNPLNYTLTALQFLKETSDTQDEDLQETLDDIGEGMFRIRDIIADLRSFAYPEQSKNKEKFFLEEALQTALRFTLKLQNNIPVQQQLEADVPLFASKNQITQVFINLISNSAYALKSHQNPLIHISSKSDTKMLNVVVKDNGPGIATDMLSKIFDPFVTDKQVGEGMGLGLSICHIIINNSGGSIAAKSQAMKNNQQGWTKICFNLPIATT